MSSRAGTAGSEGYHPASEADADTAVDQGEGSIQFEAHLTQKGGVAAQDGHVPAGAFEAQDIAKLGVEVAQVPALVQAQAHRADW